MDCLFAYLGHVCLLATIFIEFCQNVFINNPSKKPVNKDFFFFSIQILGQIWHVGKFVKLTIISTNSVIKKHLWIVLACVFD